MMTYKYLLYGMLIGVVLRAVYYLITNRQIAVCGLLLASLLFMLAIALIESIWRNDATDE